MKYNYIAIEGNIGAGKTSLSKMLAEDTDSRLLLEQFTDNPFLAKFYEDPDRYAFQVELSFLSERYQQMKTEMGHPDLFGQGVISDYYLAKSFIFSKHNLKDDEMVLFEKLFTIINLQAPRPDLYIYLHLPVEKLIDNIRLRGREYEQNISPEYLKEIQDGYFGFFKSQTDMKVVVIDTAELDFVNNSFDYQKIKKIIFEGEFKDGMNMQIL
ncbi:MAG: deoxynucleoside kinase [Bacteroidetes bacterium]|nr:deoxynucleoside kinase [Bacteroidota bacterium]